MIVIIGVDPGKLTGISVVSASGSKGPKMLEYQLIDYSTVHGLTVGDAVQNAVETYAYIKWDIHLVVERFVPERTPRGFDATPIEVIGEIKSGLRANARWARMLTTVTWPLRVEKERVDNKVLKRLGLHASGKDERHANDATRHVVNRLVALGHRPTMEKGWPDE